MRVWTQARSGGRDRRRLERLCRYVARPFLALERLAPLIPPPRAHQVRDHGVLAPCASGRDRVVPAAGSSRANAPPAEPGRAETLGVRPASPAQGIAPEDPGASCGEGEGIAPACSGPRSSPRSARRRAPWAELLPRVFELDALRCPECGQRMRVLAAITDPQGARRILECLELPARAPPLAPAPIETGEPELDAQEVPCDAGFDPPSPCARDEEG